MLPAMSRLGVCFIYTAEQLRVFAYLVLWQPLTDAAYDDLAWKDLIHALYDCS